MRRHPDRFGDRDPRSSQDVDPAGVSISSICTSASSSSSSAMRFSAIHPAISTHTSTSSWSSSSRNTTGSGTLYSQSHRAWLYGREPTTRQPSYHHPTGHDHQVGRQHQQHHHQQHQHHNQQQHTLGSSYPDASGHGDDRRRRRGYFDWPAITARATEHTERTDTMNQYDQSHFHHRPASPAENNTARGYGQGFAQSVRDAARPPRPPRPPPGRTNQDESMWSDSDSEVRSHSLASDDEELKDVAIDSDDEPEEEEKQTTASDPATIENAAHEVANAAPPPPRTKRKPSRYLREMDRRAILQRLQDGERQATIAKEYNVSRAAICNLYKHREEVLARTDENPFAKHPKKKKKKPPNEKKPRRRRRSRVALVPVPAKAKAAAAHGLLQTPAFSSAAASTSLLLPASRPQGNVHLTTSQAVQNLLTTLTDPALPLATFHRIAERVMWLVVEEALALVPVVSTQENVVNNRVAIHRHTVQLPPCAISMEPKGHANANANANPMLKIFQAIHPMQPVGIAQLSSSSSRDFENAQVMVDLLDAWLPQTLEGYNVFALDPVSDSEQAVCAVLQCLVDHQDAQEENLFVVSLITSREVVAMVQKKYPRVQLVAAWVVPDADPDPDPAPPLPAATAVASCSIRNNNRRATTDVEWVQQRLRQAYATTTTTSSS